MSTHNLCFEQKNKTISEFLSENFQILVVKFSIYLNRCVFVMKMDPKFWNPQITIYEEYLNTHWPLQNMKVVRLKHKC